MNTALSLLSKYGQLWDTYLNSSWILVGVALIVVFFLGIIFFARREIVLGNHDAEDVVGLSLLVGFVGMFVILFALPGIPLLGFATWVGFKLWNAANVSAQNALKAKEQAKLKALEDKKDALRSELIFVEELGKNFKGEKMTADEFLSNVYYGSDYELIDALKINRYYDGNRAEAVRKALETV